MAEQFSENPLQNYNPSGPSAEDIKNRLNSINSYLNAYRPEVLSGITEAQQNQASIINDVKSSQSIAKPSVARVQNIVSGNKLTGPKPGLKPFNIPNSDYVDALIAKSKIDAVSKVDPYKYARPTAFDASSAGYNFDRYYSHGKFKDLGFSIYRDNEAVYNANSTFVDDFKRMFGKWTSLAYQGGASAFKNWGKFGAVGEVQDAAQMEHDLSVAMSSKGGVGGWTTNFLANSGYTVGIMAEIALEEFALAGASALTGGGASGFAALRTSQNLKRFANSMKIMTETLNKADKAKTFWTATKGAGVSAFKGVLPFDEVFDISKQALNPNSAFNRLNDYAKMQKSFGAFYRGMREINAVTAESRLEAGFAQNKVANEALAEFYKKNGRSATPEEALSISDAANQAGKTAFIGNLGGIYLSNKLVLNTALKGFKPIRRLMNEEALTSSMYKLVRNYGWKEAGLKPMEVVSKGFLSSAKRAMSKEYLKSIPSRLTGTFSRKSAGQTLGAGLRYFSANLAEGLQESYQEALQSGVTDYYLNNYFSELYNDPHLAANNSLKASIIKGIKEQFTPQGFDTFAQGFLMGGVLGGAQNIIMPGLQRTGMKAKDWYSKTNSYEEYQKSEKERLQKYAEAYNDISENPYKYVNWLDENVALQRDLAERYEIAEEIGDRKEAEDTKDASMFNHITTLLQTERYDAFINQLEDLNDLSDSDLADAFEYTESANEQNKKSPRERLQTAIQKSKDIKSRWEKINEKFENPYNPDYFDKEKDSESYSNELISYQAFEVAKRAIAFNEYTFDRTIKRLSSLVNNAAANGPLGNVAAMDFSALYSNDDSFKRYKDAIESEIVALNLGDSTQKTLAKKKQTQLENLLKLKVAMQEYSNKLAMINLAKEAMANPEAASEKSKMALEELRKIAKTHSKDIYDETTKQYIINFEEGLKDEIAPDVIVDEALKNELYAAYAKYTKNIADLNNVFPIRDAIENSFGDLVDYIKLDQDAKHMSEYADIIANPMSIYQMTERVSRSLKTVEAKKKELHLEGLTKYKRNILDVDDLLQKLLDLGVYFDPDHISDFRKNGVIPPYFIDAVTGNVILKDNPKYNQVVALIEEEEKLRGVTFSGKPVQYKKPEEKKPEASEKTTTPVEDFEEAVVYNITTEFSKFPDNIKTKLKDAHTEAVKNGATTDIQDWMLEDPDAALIISGKDPISKPKKKDDSQPVETEETPDSTLISKSNPKSFVGAPLEFKEEFDNLAKENWKLSPDQKTYKSTDDVAKRVSDLKEGKVPDTPATKASANRGNFIDEVFRFFAEPTNGISTKDIIINEKKEGKTDYEVKENLKLWVRTFSTNLSIKYNIGIDEGYIDSFSDILFDLALRYQDFNWYTSVPTLVGTLVGEKYAGTIDLMVEKNGNYTIIDLKTSTRSRRISEELYSKNDQIQQNAYAELWEQVTGKPVIGTFILNLITDMSSTNTIQNIELDTHTTADKKKTILTYIPRKSVAELKGYKPETPEETSPTASASEAPATPISDIESEKQKITSSEFKEVVRLAKFFLENPREPGVKGDARSKYPELFKAITDTEKRRQEDLDKLKENLENDLKEAEKEPDSAPKIKIRKADGSIDSNSIRQNAIEAANSSYEYGLRRINAKYDAKLADLEDKSTAPVSDVKAKKADIEKYKGKSKFSSKKEKTTLYLSPSLSVENSKEELKNTIFDLLDILSKNKDVIFLEGGIRRIIENSQIWYPFSVLGDYLAGRYKTSIDKVISEFKKSGFTESELDIIKESLENKVSPYAELDALEGAKPAKQQLDWNAVIDRAASAKEVEKIIDQIYAAGAESPELIDRALVKKDSFPKTVTELKEAIVQRLKAGDTITGTVSKKSTDDPTIFEFTEEGKPSVVFYNKGTAEPITAEDVNKIATLNLVEKLVTPSNKEFYNVVEVYIDGKYVGNVAETDYKATNLSDTIIKASDPEELINNFSLYTVNPKLRSKFTYKTKDDIEQIYTFEEIIDLTKQTLSKMSIPTEEKNSYLTKIDAIVQSELGLSEKKISPEDKKSAQDAIDNAADRSVDVDGSDINDAINQSQEDIDNDFDNSLDCK